MPAKNRLQGKIARPQARYILASRRRYGALTIPPIYKELSVLAPCWVHVERAFWPAMSAFVPTFFMLRGASKLAAERTLQKS